MVNLWYSGSVEICKSFSYLVSNGKLRVPGEWHWIARMSPMEMIKKGSIWNVLID